MFAHRIIIISAALTNQGSASLAGPCSAEIERIQGRVQALLYAEANSGPSGRESTWALMHRQPTPASVAAAEERLGELSGPTFDTIERAIALAREYDGLGNKQRCERALSNASSAICQIGAAADPACR
jgi:hypothetical protein